VGEELFERENIEVDRSVRGAEREYTDMTKNKLRTGHTECRYKDEAE